MVVQSIKAYWKMPVMPRGTIPLPFFHRCITLLRVKLGVKSFPYLQAKTFIILDLPTYMILSVTSIEEFPGDGYTLL